MLKSIMVLLTLTLFLALPGSSFAQTPENKPATKQEIKKFFFSLGALQQKPAVYFTSPDTPLPKRTTGITGEITFQKPKWSLEGRTTYAKNDYAHNLTADGRAHTTFAKICFLKPGIGARYHFFSSSEKVFAQESLRVNGLTRIQALVGEISATTEIKKWRIEIEGSYLVGTAEFLQKSEIFINGKQTNKAPDYNIYRDIIYPVDIRMAQGWSSRITLTPMKTVRINTRGTILYINRNPTQLMPERQSLGQVEVIIFPAKTLGIAVYYTARDASRGSSLPPEQFAVKAMFKF